MSEAPRCYTWDQVAALLQVSVLTLQRARRDGKTPYLEELQPAISRRSPRFRADLVDAHLNGRTADVVAVAPSLNRRRRTRLLVVAR